MPPADLGFLHALLTTPSDDTARLVYADWLDEHSDPRAAYIRIELRLATLPEDHADYDLLRDQLRSLWMSLDPAWVAVVAKRYDLYLGSYPASQKIQAIKLVREVSGLGLKEAKDLVESLPGIVPGRGLTRQGAEQAMARFPPGCQVSIRPSPVEASDALEVQFRALQAGLPENWLPDWDRPCDLCLGEVGWWIVDRVDFALADLDGEGFNRRAHQPGQAVRSAIPRARAVRGWGLLYSLGLEASVRET